MKTVALESLVVGTILTFCENAAELGCPKDQEVDMWFRCLSEEEQFKVADKMMEIEERSSKMNKEETVKEDKIITMHEMELDLDKKTIDGLCKYALKNIKNDTEALVNYAANKILDEIIKTDGECLKSNE